MDSRRYGLKFWSKRPSRTRKPGKKRAIELEGNGSARNDDSAQTCYQYRMSSFPLFSPLPDNIDEDFLQTSACSTPNLRDEVRYPWKEDEASSLFTSTAIYTQTALVYDGPFPFQDLPVDCKLKVFGFLNSLDKGIAAQVCSEWNHLMQTSRLWRSISFSDFPLCCVSSADHRSVLNCYTCYRSRVHQFIEFLVDVRPVLQNLEFKFDIAESEDGYLPLLETLLNSANCQELRCAHLNWKETPIHLYLLETSMRWSQRCDEVMQKHRRRQRLFVHFFDSFTAIAPNLSTLVLPFDWSESSVASLARLQNLHSLVLEKYFVFQYLKQDLLDTLLTSLPNLRRLMLEVWTPSGQGLVLFSLTSASIEYLDISQSRGFYLQAVTMPCLTRLRIARHPWNGPLVMADRLSLPCLYCILADGALNLCKINDHYLESGWRDCSYNRLEEVLKSVCSCRQHKTGWAM